MNEIALLYNSVADFPIPLHKLKRKQVRSPDALPSYISLHCNITLSSFSVFIMVV
jgi:hypothetical protein